MTQKYNNIIMATFIKTSTTGIVTTFGKFTSIAKPGLRLYVPYVQDVYHISNRTQQEDFKFRVLTGDKVFANLSLAVQYKIKEDDVVKAMFSLKNPISQMSSYIENSLRSHAPKTTLADLFVHFDKMSETVEKDLREKMSGHGFTLENILMTGIEPDKEVTDAINKISASERLKEAEKNKAEAEYVRRIKEAEADRDRKILQGQGVAGQRKAIIDSYRENISDLVKITGMNPVEIMNFILCSQELDTREQIGRSQNTKVLFVNDNNKPQQNLMTSLEATK